MIERAGKGWRVDDQGIVPMKLQIASRLAILAVLELAADSGRQHSVGEIGAKYGVSNHHLAKVMHVLGRAGLVRSVRGAGGGYQFCGNARRVTLLDIIQLFEVLGRDDVADAGRVETREERAFGEVLGEVDDIAQATLGSITIETMLKLTRRQPLSEADAATETPNATSRDRMVM